MNFEFKVMKVLLTILNKFQNFKFKLSLVKFLFKNEKSFEKRYLQSG